jgi:cobalamin biosynthesis Mg chelatase CobN
MQHLGKIVAVSAVLGFLILMVCPVSAGPAGDRISGLLNRLAGEGYDVSAIESALVSGDNATARSLMDQFREANADAFPAPTADGMRGNSSRLKPPADGTPGNCSRMDGLLNMLDEQGYDVSTIESALTSGDMVTARSLMDQFREANADAFPTPPADGMRGNSSRLELPAPCIGDRQGDGRGISRLLDTLDEQGYDVSSIQSAAESGEITSARTLIQQFLDANQIERPAPPDGVLAGNCRMGRNIQA